MLTRVSQSMLSVALFLATATPALAQLDVQPGVPGGFSDLNNTIRTIFRFVILLASIVFVILFLIGGVQYLTAAGNDEQTGKAKKLLVDAIIGLVIVLAAWAIGNFIIGKLVGQVNTTQEGTIGGTGNL